MWVIWFRFGAVSHWIFRLSQVSWAATTRSTWNTHQHWHRANGHWLSTQCGQAFGVTSGLAVSVGVGVGGTKCRLPDLSIETAERDCSQIRLRLNHHNFTTFSEPFSCLLTIASLELWVRQKSLAYFYNLGSRASWRVPGCAWKVPEL